MTDWCIIRTSGSKTLKLAQTLQADGYDVWTPAETRTMRIPRANVRRTVTLPIMPSYIFARAIHLIDLLQLAAMPVKPRRGGGPSHVGFSVMHSFDGIPMIHDRHLNGLRTLEAKRTPRRKAKRMPIGGEVKVDGGSFGGMIGKVERSDEGQTTVCFGRGFTVKLPTSLLRINDVSQREVPNVVRKAA